MDIHLDGISHSYDGFEVMRDISLEISSGQDRLYRRTIRLRQVHIVCALLAGWNGRKAGAGVLQLGEPPEGCLNPLTYIFQDFRAACHGGAVSGNISLVLEDHGIRGKRRRTRSSRMCWPGRNSRDFAKGTAQATVRRNEAAGGHRPGAGGQSGSHADGRAVCQRSTAQTRELLMDDLVDLWTRQPFTAVYVTHNLAEAVRLGHRVVVLSRRPGQIREIDRYRKTIWPHGSSAIRSLDAATKSHLVAIDAGRGARGGCRVDPCLSHARGPDRSPFSGGGFAPEATALGWCGRSSSCLIL